MEPELDAGLREREMTELAENDDVGLVRSSAIRL